MDAFDREVQHLEEQLDDGDISSSEYNEEMHALEQEYRYAAQESAQRAYDDEINQW